MYHTQHTHPPAPAAFPPGPSTSAWHEHFAQREQPRTHAHAPDPVYADFYPGPPHPDAYHHQSAPMPRATPSSNRYNPYARPPPPPHFSRPPPPPVDMYGQPITGYPMPYPADPAYAQMYPPMPAVHRRPGPPPPTTHVPHPAARLGPMPIESPQQQQQRRRNYQKKPYPDGCHVCGISNTPEWRRGPSGLRTLCNACGLSAKKFKHPEAKSVDEVMQQLLEIARARQRKAEDFVLSPQNVERVKASFKGEKTAEPTPAPKRSTSRKDAAAAAEAARVAAEKAYTDIEMDSASLLCSLGVATSPPSAGPVALPQPAARPPAAGNSNGQPASAWNQSQSESDVVHALTLMREGNSPSAPAASSASPPSSIFTHSLPVPAQTSPVEVPVAQLADRPRSATEARQDGPADRVRPASRAASEADAAARRSGSASPGGNPMSIAALCNIAGEAQ